MAVPSSGQLKLWDTLWNQELGGSKGENSLHSASVYAGFSTPDALSDFYGWSDVEVPVVQTNSVDNVQVNSQRLNGNLQSTGNEAVNRGFYHGTSTTRTSNTKYTLGGTQNSTGGFNCTRTGLSQATTYYNWAFACNSAGEAVGNRVQANTGYPPYTPNFQKSGVMCGNAGNGHYPPTSEFQGDTFSGRGCSGWYNPYSGGGNNLVTCTISKPSYEFCAQGFQWASGIKNYHGSCVSGNAYYCGGPYGSFPPQFLVLGQHRSFTQPGISRGSNNCSKNCSFSTPNHFTHDPVQINLTSQSDTVSYGLGTAGYNIPETMGGQGNMHACWDHTTASDIRLKTNINYL